MSSNQDRRRQGGFSLSEVLVATAILVIVFVGILMLYDRGNRVFKSGNEASEMQQNLRIGYERMVGDIRMAGFDYKRGGPLLPGQTAAPWAPTRQYSAGTLVTPVVPNGHTYRALGGGTSGTTVPAFPTGTGATVVENGATPPITWAENGGAVYEQPDEQVEYAGATALTMRGNFDYSANETGDTDHGREPALEGAQFPVVTTDNQEIVTYALVSNSAPAGTAPNNQSITMYVDVNNSGTPARVAHPGGSAENLKTITGLDLTNNNPPYTLYRFAFNDDGTVQRTPLADNIRSLNFFYFSDPAGQQPLRDAAGVLAPNIGGGGQYDPGVAGSITAPDRLVRKKIRGIRVHLVGMNAVADSNYSDTSTANGQLGSTSTAGVPTFVTDTVATRFRRVTVDTLIVPRNLGMTGMPQTFLQPPPRPTITSVCFGYCGIAVVNWDPNTNNPNASFAVAWDTDQNGSFSNSFDAGTGNTFAVDLTQEDLTQTYWFQVRAYNAGGSVFSTNKLSASAQNATVPNGPNTIVASGAGAIAPISGKIRLTWAAPITNASGTPSCAPSGTPGVTNYLREIKGFRIYRDTTANFNGGLANRIVTEDASGSAAPQTDGYGNYWYDDTAVTCGQTYYYRLRTIEWCQVNADYNTSSNANDSISDFAPLNSNPGIPGQSGTTGIPQAPVNLVVAPLAPTAPPLGMTNSQCNFSMNVCYPINLQWSKVTQDVNASPVAIDNYEIERSTFDNLGVFIPGSVVSIPVTGALAIVGSTVTYADTAQMYDPMTAANYIYKYRVRAKQNPPSCPDGNWGPLIQFPPPCTFSGSVVVQTGASSGDGLTPISAWVMNAGDTIQVSPPGGTTLVSTTMTIVDPGGTIVGNFLSNTSPANFAWINLNPGTPYTCTFTMTNNASPPCTEQLVRYIQQEPLPACSLTTFASQSSVLQNTATTYQMQLNLVNAATEALNLTELDFNWTTPTRITWNSIKFPSTAGATMAGPGTTSGNVTFVLSPLPAQLTTNDVTVPANGTRSILINMAKTNGNPANITPAIVNTLCVRYTRASVTIPSGGVQVPFVFHCQIKPDQNVNNPNTCQ